MYQTFPSAMFFIALGTTVLGTTEGRSAYWKVAVLGTLTGWVWMTVRSWIFIWSRHPIARLFDGLTDWLRNQMENRSVGLTIWWNWMESDMTDWIGFMASIFFNLFLSLHEMHCGINITKIVCYYLGSGKEKLVGNRWNLNWHKSPQITFVNSHAFKLFKIGQWDASLKSKWFINLEYSYKAMMVYLS